MAFPGQRFNLDLDADNWTFNVEGNERDATDFEQNVVHDIQERESSNIPPAPALKSTKTGFPEHKTKRTSAFKQQRQNAKAPAAPRAGQPEVSDQAIIHQIAKKHGVDLATAKEKRDIDLENQQRINAMSAEDIEEARSEIMSTFSPEFLKRFMQRARPDEDEHPQDPPQSEPEPTLTETQTPTNHSQPKKTVSFSSNTPNPLSQTDTTSPNSHIQESRTPQLHFPSPPPTSAPILDPSDPNFHLALKEKYFPTLPHDPSKTSWMQDPTPSDLNTSPYSPSNTGFPSSQIRFSFTGRLIPPREALEIPVTAGLHHHGDAPASAGYTIPELAMLARSALPSQRCVAYQTVGRILYRLGKGEFGDRGAELSEGLWGVVERERVLEGIMSEANRAEGSGHASARAYAIEAVWLWRRGGGGDRGVLKDGQRRAE